MFYALLMVCPLAAAPCDLDRAIYTDRSPAIFATVDECFGGALAHLEFTAIPRLKEDAEYEVEIECEMIGEPA